MSLRIRKIHRPPLGVQLHVETHFRPSGRTHLNKSSLYIGTNHFEIMLYLNRYFGVHCWFNRTSK